jgi:hypothetical protein
VKNKTREKKPIQEAKKLLNNKIHPIPYPKKKTHTHTHTQNKITKTQKVSSGSPFTTATGNPLKLENSYEIFKSV